MNALIMNTAEISSLDFKSSFWPIYISVISILGILGCLWLLYASAKAKVDATEDNTTGHVWDEDLTEMNNPLPRWWMWKFVIMIIFGIGYLIAYPGLGSFKGYFNWTQQDAYVAERAKYEELEKQAFASFINLDIQEISKNEAAMKIGQSLFRENCAQCHASDGGGGHGFPNLRDGDWLHGGDVDAIKQTITFGVGLHPEGRHPVMPSQLAAMGDDPATQNANSLIVANYVKSLSGLPHNTDTLEKGKELFQTCSACHGEEGKGNQTIGAPNLSDRIWLHAQNPNDLDAFIVRVIRYGINSGEPNAIVSQMPAQVNRLKPEYIKVLTAYVWGLSNNQQ